MTNHLRPNKHAEKAFIENWRLRYSKTQTFDETIPRKMIRDKIGIYQNFLAGWWAAKNDSK